MKEERRITLDGHFHTVVISDEEEALLAADAAGRVIIGLWDRNNPNQKLTPAVYLTEHIEDIDLEYLERVVRRKLGLPWMIAETNRLRLREFCMEDIARVVVEESDREADRVFDTPKLLEEYIRNQYGFYQYGIWAVVEKSENRLVGKAGISNVDASLPAYQGMWTEEKPSFELGYHIFGPYRRQGYGGEACRAIQEYVKNRMDAALYVQIDRSNAASLKLAEDCGFHLIQQRCNESERCYSLYGWNC